MAWSCGPDQETKTPVNKEPPDRALLHVDHIQQVAEVPIKPLQPSVSRRADQVHAMRMGMVVGVLDMRQSASIDDIKLSTLRDEERGWQSRQM